MTHGKPTYEGITKDYAEIRDIILTHKEVTIWELFKKYSHTTVKHWNTWKEIIGHYTSERIRLNNKKEH